MDDQVRKPSFMEHSESELRIRQCKGKNAEGAETSMKLSFNGPPAIEDMRHHPRETVERLGRLLAGGARARPDPRRQNFYEVEDGPGVFYIYISPATAKVHLLATWGNDRAAACA